MFFLFPAGCGTPARKVLPSRTPSILPFSQASLFFSCRLVISLFFLTRGWCRSQPSLLCVVLFPLFQDREHPLGCSQASPFSPAAQPLLIYGFSLFLKCFEYPSPSSFHPWARKFPRATHEHFPFFSALRLSFSPRKQVSVSLPNQKDFSFRRHYFLLFSLVRDFEKRFPS